MVHCVHAEAQRRLRWALSLELRAGVLEAGAGRLEWAWELRAWALHSPKAMEVLVQRRFEGDSGRAGRRHSARDGAIGTFDAATLNC